MEETALPDEKSVKGDDVLENMDPNSFLAAHFLTSTERGHSEIEKVASKINNRRNNRIEVTGAIRIQFLKECRAVALSKGLRAKIDVEDLRRLRNECARRYEASNPVDSEMKRSVFSIFGSWDVDHTLLELYSKGLELVEGVESNWFYFRDFSFYYTRIVPTRRLSQNPTISAVKWLFLFYVFTAVLFCPIMNQESICPTGDEDRPYLGWLTAIYFASVTMSTVGYGDFSIAPSDTDEDWRLLVATIYMIVAMWVGYTVFAVAADAALSGLSISSLGEALQKLINTILPTDDNLSLDQQINRIKFARITELLLLGIFYNFIGIVAAKIFILVDDQGEDWSWMATLYWAVQTTTTVGYGDVALPVDMRWFQIFYTTLGTVLVGSVFGGIASLSQELRELKRFYAWRRREVSKQLLEDMQGNNSDGKIDQYEFLVSSLLVLNKLQSSDIDQIMDRFRELAGAKGYISYDAGTVDELGIENDNDALDVEQSTDEMMMMDIDDDDPTFL